MGENVDDGKSHMGREEVEHVRRCEQWTRIRKMERGWDVEDRKWT